ncbi:MAG TPA: NADAR family protein [Verrucomicrobiae bacterium]|nr:NADAR family protein [Verrucomicrobiae bacterium]
MNQILFYKINDPHGGFSNFSPHPFELNGRRWLTSEHYFQAQKFIGTEHEELIRLAASPMTAAKMGRDRARPLRKDWEIVKDDVMREALRAKFAQHPALRQELLDTQDAKLIEHTVNDRYWADGGDGTGGNRLGELLMELREQIRNDSDK